jgi:hypothetical protein
MRTILRACLAGLIGLSAIWFSPRAQASCHSFQVEVKATVTEGSDVTVIVTRDDDLDDSSVQLRTSNGTATAPGDYDATIQYVDFTDETSKTVKIATTEDDIGEKDEYFWLKLGSARGCRAYEDSYEYGEPAKARISDDDGDATAEPTAEATEEPDDDGSPEPTASPEATESAEPTEEPTAEPTEEPSPSAIALPTPEAEDDDDLNPALVGAAVAALVLAGAGALILTRMRRGAI